MTSLQHFQRSVDLPASVGQAFAYHDRPGALDRLTPPWESVSVESSDQSLAVGSRVVLKTSLAGIPLRWVAEHTDYQPPEMFADTQLSGPFAQWDHQHFFRPQPQSPSASQLTDSIDYRLPVGLLGQLLGGGLVRRKIETMFAYRHRITRDDLQLMSDYPDSKLRVAISGSGGLVGGHLQSMLTLLGHSTQAIVRRSGSSSDSESLNEIAIWEDPSQSSKLNGTDVVVHLAGKSIAGQRWNDQVKQEIRDSRVIKTRQLCEAIASCDRKPRVLICASATGIYGDRGDELLTEQSAMGDDFLAQVASDWEAACQPAVDAGVRVVNCRFGIILSAKGGALAKMLLPAKFAGGSLGGGRQWWSWIALDDVVGAIYHTIFTEQLAGPVNFVAPESITNAEFAKVLARVLNRPALLPAPAFALRLAMGEMADALLLASTRAVPSALHETGYSFRFPDLEQALRYSLGRTKGSVDEPMVRGS